MPGLSGPSILRPRDTVKQWQSRQTNDIAESAAALVALHRFRLSCAKPTLNRRSLTNVPTLELVSLRKAKLTLSLTGKRGAIMREYMDYIGQLESGRAGKLSPNDGETAAAIRRRLGAAAQLMGKSLTIQRQEDTIYFWEEGQAPRRRGRPRKNPAA